MKKALAITSSLVLLAAVCLYGITVSGTVSNASNDAAIQNAIVTMTVISGAGMNTYRDTTDASGAYSLALRTGAANGQLGATATGFQPTGQYVRFSTRDTTIDISMTPTGAIATTGKITGVASDTGGNAIQGVQVILVRRQGGGAGTPVDTMLTGTTGRFTFDSLAANRYDLVASKVGLTVTNPTDLVGIIVIAGQTDTVDITLRPNAAITRIGSVRGKITAQTGGAGLAAQVVLDQTIGGVLTPVDTVTAAATGNYSFLTVPAGRNYAITASMTGYVTRTSTAFTVDSGVTDTMNLALATQVAAAGIVKGTVSDTGGNAIDGAQVILRRSGATQTPIDTMLSASGGKFSFTGLAVGTYSLAVSKANYQNYTTPFNQMLQLTTNPDTATASVTLRPMAMGTLVVFVDTGATTTHALAGVSIAATEVVTIGQNGQTFTGVTGTNGYANLGSVPVATYSVTASLAGFNTVVRTTNVANGAHDTLTIEMQPATGSSKLVKGTVKTSTGTNIAQAVVILTATRYTGGTALTIVDTTDNSGAYSIAGIPVAYTRIDLLVSKTGYVTKDTNGISIANDTTTVNIVLQSATGIIAKAQGHAPAGFSIVSTAQGPMLQLTGFDSRATLSVFSASGVRVMDREVSGLSFVALPGHLSHQMLVVQVQQGSKILRQKVMMP